MLTDSHKAVVKAYAEAFSRGDLDAVCKCFAPDAVVHGVLGWGEIEKVRPIWEQFMASFQMKLQIESLVAEGNTVVARYVERGTFVAAFRGSEPTGKSYEVVAMEWFEFAGEKIARRWGARDSATISRQLGIPLK